VEKNFASQGCRAASVAIIAILVALEKSGNADVVCDFIRTLAELIPCAKLVVIATFNQQDNKFFVAAHRRGVER
jgi:hypothetical protein